MERIKTVFCCTLLMLIILAASAMDGILELIF